MTKQDKSEWLFNNIDNEILNPKKVVIGTSGKGKNQYYKEHVKSLKRKK